VSEGDGWDGFEPGPSGDMVCLECRCLVRQTRGDAAAHRAWHDKVESVDPR